LSLRWEFVPGIEGTDRAVYWRWRAFTQAGTPFSESEQSFDTFTECIADAKRHGYERDSGA
jgi:hypothetical protein